MRLRKMASNSEILPDSHRRPHGPYPGLPALKTLLSSTGRGANKVVFLGMEVDLKGFKPALWILLVLAFYCF
jgi:hypothetical protein